MIYTPITRCGTPLCPIRCPICGELLGAAYRDGLSLKGYATECSSRCVDLWKFGRAKAGWRALPLHLRPVELAARKLEHASRKTTPP